MCIAAAVSIAACAGNHLVGARARVAGFDPTGWIEITAGEFVLTGDMGEERLLKVAEELAIFAAVVRRVSTVEIPTPRVPLRIYVFRDPEIFDVFRADRSVGGFYLERLDGHYIGLMADLNPGATRVTVFHEYAHFLLRADAERVYPRWYSEGRSEMLSAVQIRQDLVTLGPPPARLVDILMQDDRVSFENVFGFEWRPRMSLWDVHRFYAHSWGVVHYFSVSQERNRQLARFLRQIFEGADWRSAFESVFDTPVATLEDEVSAHIRRAVRSPSIAGTYFDVRELPVVRDWKSRVLAASEICYQLGVFALSLFEEQSSVARAFFERALDLDPGYARARAARGTTLALEGEFAAARTSIARALHEAPGDPVINSHAGRLALLEAQHARANEDTATARARLLDARNAYQRVIELSPGSPVGYAGLGSTYAEEADDPGAAIAALEHAREIGAWDPEMNLELGRLYLEAGDEAHARQRLGAVIQGTHDGAVAGEAKSLLGQLDSNH